MWRRPGAAGLRTLGSRCEAGWLLLCGGCTEELLLDRVLVHLVLSTEVGHGDTTTDDAPSRMGLTSRG